LTVSTASVPRCESDGSERSYAQIVRSSALIGGSTALNILVGLVRTKAFAVLLGPSGIGLLGIFGSIVDVARGVAGWGVSAGAVRQVAESASRQEASSVARTAVALRRLSLGLALAGGLLMAIASTPISVITFGDASHAGSVALLALAVAMRVVSDGQSALLQGLRRVADLARINLFGALLGTVGAVAAVAALGFEGPALALVALSAGGLIVSWWHARRVRFEPVKVDRRQIRDLLALGTAFMGSGLMTLGAAFAVRWLVLQNEGLDSAGLYHAAWTLGGLCVGIVLQAMGTDFYPRLVGAITDAARANRLVNEQTHASLLLAGPAVLLTIVLADPVVRLCYSSQFVDAVPVLRWIVLGMALRVVSWPLGYVIIACDRKSLFFGVDLAWTVVNVALSWWCLQRFGLEGAGIAFFASYVFHAVVVYGLARHLTGFRWTTEVGRVGGLFAICTGLVVGLLYLVPGSAGFASAVLVGAAVSAWSLRGLLLLMPRQMLPAGMGRLANWLQPGRGARQ
jgi:PST family polysaccharide transporter